MEDSLPHPADFLTHNARVFTADPTNPQAEAVAVRGNQIVFVGSKLDAEAWRGSHTRRIDGQQCSLLPGFIDSLPEKEEFRARIPMERYGTVEEIAAVVAFLASDGAGYITGQNLRVDGGITRSV